MGVVGVQPHFVDDVQTPRKPRVGSIPEKRHSLLHAESAKGGDLDPHGSYPTGS
jgi:hypothetical protein